MANSLRVSPLPVFFFARFVLLLLRNQKTASFICPQLRLWRQGFAHVYVVDPSQLPKDPAWNGVKTTVSRALKLIDGGALDHQTMSQFAMRLGVGERYPRQLFAEHIGLSPTAIARSRRVMVAKCLITDSQKTMAEIAHLAGFASIRQFNDTFKILYGKTPGALRKLGK